MADTTDIHTAPFDYAAITAEAIPGACDHAIARSDEILAGVASVPDGERTLANTLAPLDEVANVLGIASGVYGFMAYVHSDEPLRDVALEYEQKLDTYSTSLGFREDVYRAVSAYAATPEAAALDGVEARLLERTLRDYRRNGFDLPAAERARVQELKERLVPLGVQFRRNIDEFEDYLLLTRDQLNGMPDSYIDRLQTVETDGGPRYRVSLDYPEMYPFLEGAEDGALRGELFVKNHNKAAEENLPLLSEAIAIRDEIASILGYASWAAYVIETKMAKTPEAAADFLVDLERRVRVKADRDIEELQAS
ncbi:MAG: M3 family metallopeptidase, partial [Dehalococcoidia bacterium]